MYCVLDTIKQEHDELLYRNYVTDCLMAIANGSYEKPIIKTRYIDLAIPETEEEEPEEVNIAEKVKVAFKKFTRKGGRTI